MKAKVKNITLKEEEFVDDNGCSDMFCMDELIGRTINVELKYDSDNGKPYRNWFVGATDETDFNFHSSWLEFFEEKPIMSDGDKFLKGLMEEIDGGNLIPTESSHWFPLYLDRIREYLSKFEN